MQARRARLAVVGRFEPLSVDAARRSSPSSASHAWNLDAVEHRRACGGEDGSAAAAHAMARDRYSVPTCGMAIVRGSTAFTALYGRSRHAAPATSAAEPPLPSAAHIHEISTWSRLSRDRVIPISMRARRPMLAPVRPARQQPREPTPIVYARPMSPLTPERGKQATFPGTVTDSLTSRFAPPCSDDAVATSLVEKAVAARAAAAKAYSPPVRIWDRLNAQDAHENFALRATGKMF